MAIAAFAVLLIFSAASTLLAYVPVQAVPVPAQAAPQEVNVKVPKPKPTVSSRQVLEPAPAPQPAFVSTSKVAGKRQPQQEKITGTIVDPTGGVIPGVTISIFDARTNELLGTAFSAANGSFEISPPAGNYYIQFAFPGFQTQVFINSQLEPSPLMIGMELGQVKEVVTVITAAQPAAENRGLKKEPIYVGGNVYQPKLIRRVDPVYPPEARDANVEGGVVVSALIDRDGNVKDAVVLSGHRLLRDAALECVNQWRYQPALLDGTPWPIRLSITINFKLQR